MRAMEFNIKFVLLTLALQICKSLSYDEAICPSFEEISLRNDSSLYQMYKREITRGIWQSPQLSRPTKLVAQLRDIILEMSDSDSYYFTEIAFQITGWSTCFLAEVSHFYPNFCPFASIINKTVEWNVTGDTNKYIETLRETADAVPYALSSLTHASLTELGCKNICEPVRKKESCWENGLVSNQDGVWEAYGRLMPWPLRNIAALLAKSMIFSDRAYATMLSFVLTPAQYFHFINQPYPLLFETGRYYIHSVNNSKCCCDQWFTRLDEINHILDERVHDVIHDKIEKLLNEC